MQNGIQRQANLKVLFERAKQYESASFKGLYNFINFIEKLRLSSGDLGSAKIIGENDDVIRIMSIHKSKGLEFPVIFLANSNKQFNKQDIRKDDVLLHQKYGLGIKYIDYNMQLRYETVAREMIKGKIEIENLSEEMRILYVALTRAKEKIYITGTGKEIQKKLDTLQKNVDIYKKENGKIKSSILKNCNSYLDWILQTYLYNKQKTEEIAEINVIQKNDIKEIWQEIKADEEETDINKKIKEEIENSKTDKNIAQKIKETLEYKYPFEETTNLPTKMSVSEIKKGKSGEETINLTKPKFLQEEKDKKLTGAEKGTLMHLCMQYLDINKEYDYAGLESFVKDLVAKNIITEKEKQAIYLQTLYTYTKSEIWQELKQAKLMEREKPFYIMLPAKEIYELEKEKSAINQDNNDKILVQGIIDLYYINKNNELILLDYKTDFANDENELVDKYKVQLEIYKRALEKALGRKVDKVYIYSLYLQKIIEIN